MVSNLLLKIQSNWNLIFNFNKLYINIKYTKGKHSGLGRTDNEKCLKINKLLILTTAGFVTSIWTVSLDIKDSK